MCLCVSVCEEFRFTLYVFSCHLYVAHTGFHFLLLQQEGRQKEWQKLKKRSRMDNLGHLVYGRMRLSLFLLLF